MKFPVSARVAKYSAVCFLFITVAAFMLIERRNREDQNWFSEWSKHVDKSFLANTFTNVGTNTWQWRPTPSTNGPTSNETNVVENKP